MHVQNLIIGAGQAGPSLAVRLANAGQSVALVERNLLGGTCVNTGCMPTKTLVASAAVAHTARRAADFGILIDGEIRVDPVALKRRHRQVTENARAGLQSWLQATPNLQLVHGHARFVDPHTVQVDDRQISADRIVLNLGGRARIPDLPGLDEVPYLTNSSLLDLDVLPEHLIVIGGSYIGLEFAQMYRRFSSRVTVVEQGPRLVSKEDPEVSQALQEILQGEGVDVQCHAECIRLSPGPVVHLDQNRSVHGSHVLLAVGRQPNTAHLPVELDARGYVRVNAQLQTSLPHIYALGDCNGRGAFTHTAFNDYELLAAHLLDGQAIDVGRRVTGYALFPDPPLARAGLTETEARKSHRVRVATRPMTRVNRAVESGDTRGFMKIVVDADSDRILGASLLGIHCDEAIHQVLLAMRADLPYTTLQSTVPVHPTVTELLPTLLSDLKP